MDIAALSMALNQGKLQQQAGISIMKIAMGVASEQSNSIAAMASDTSKAMESSVRPYLGASFDITDFLNFNSDNVITVRADATQYEGWFYEGAGIYRHVWLNQYQNVHIATDGIFAYSTVANNKATVTVETTVANENFDPASYSVSAYVTDRSGNMIGAVKELPMSLNVNEEKVSKQRIVVNAPKLWSLEDPYLYRVTVQLKQAGKVVDTRTMRIGIRTIEIKTNGVFLNGKHFN